MAQPVIGFGKIGVMAQARSEPPGKPGLAGIDFPRVDIGNQRQSLGGSAAESVAGVPEREHPQGSASSHRHVLPAKLESADGILGERSGLGLYSEGEPRRAGNAVYVVMDGKDTGVVGKTALGQYIESP